MSGPPPDPQQPVDILPTWAPLSNLSDRSDSLMAQNWQLLSNAAALFNAEREPWTHDAVDELADIMAESLDVDLKFQAARTAEFEEWLHRQWGE